MMMMHNERQAYMTHSKSQSVASSSLIRPIWLFLNGPPLIKIAGIFAGIYLLVGPNNLKLIKRSF